MLISEKRYELSRASVGSSECDYGKYKPRNRVQTISHLETAEEPRAVPR